MPTDPPAGTVLEVGDRLTLIVAKSFPEVAPVVGTSIGKAQRALKQDGFKVRTRPDEWEAGKFVHPHDACFDKDGNIFVAEWVQTGRITFLKKVS